MEEAVAGYTARAAEKMRRQALATAHLAVFIETNRFKPGERQYFASKPVQLPVATSRQRQAHHGGAVGLRAIWRAGYRYKKAGVTAARSASGQPGAGKPVRQTRRCAPHHAHAHDRHASTAPRPRHRQLRRRRHTAAMEDAARAAIAVLYDGLGRAAASVAGPVDESLVMNEPRKHQYIPVFYLKQWAGADRRVCEYRRVMPGKVVTRRTFPPAPATWRISIASTVRPVRYRRPSSVSSCKWWTRKRITRSKNSSAVIAHRGRAKCAVPGLVCPIAEVSQP